jgi:6-phosphogluconolactonase (cycloisomerase 2 family)
MRRQHFGRRGNTIAAGLHPFAVAVAPSGNFIYVSNWGAHDISAYRIERSWGAISPVAGTPFASGRWPHSLAIAPSKEFLYSANGDSNDVSAFSINEATGALEQVVGSPYRAGNHPEFVIISPSGEFAYVCNGFAGTISGYRIDAASGGLHELAGSPFAKNPWRWRSSRRAVLPTSPIVGRIELSRRMDRDRGRAFAGRIRRPRNRLEHSAVDPIRPDSNPPAA